MVIRQSDLEDLTRKGVERGVDLQPGMARVEERLRRVSRSELPFLETTSRYLIDAGGKRFRPMLVLLCGLLGGVEPTADDLVDAAVVVELVHLSTLYHDDVIDGADLRRGAPAAHVRWSNSIAILTGDHLLARASELSAALGVEVTRTMARTIADLCRGQIRELQGSAEARSHQMTPVEPTREHYLEVIGEKTASLISSSCRLGALLSGQDPESIQALSTYGWRLGLAFQLADDVLDVTARATESGKLAGTDLRQGVRTLPVLLALESDGAGSRLAALLTDPVAGADEALALLQHHPSLELARAAARREAAAAATALEAITAPLRPAALDGLRALADYAATRVG